MKREFKFRSNHNCDILLVTKSAIPDLGYNDNIHLVPAVWFYHLQVTGKNLFRQSRFNLREKLPLETREQERLEQILSKAEELPLPREEFNIQLAILGCGGAGLGRTVYKWKLKEDGLFHFEADEHNTFYLHETGSKRDILVLSPEKTTSFVKDYLHFLNTTHQMGCCYGWSCTQIEKLRNALDRI